MFSQAVSLLPHFTSGGRKGGCCLPMSDTRELAVSQQTRRGCANAELGLEARLLMPQPSGSPKISPPWRNIFPPPSPQQSGQPAWSSLSTWDTPVPSRNCLFADLSLVWESHIWVPWIWQLWQLAVKEWWKAGMNKQMWEATVFFYRSYIMVNHIKIRYELSRGLQWPQVPLKPPFHGDSLLPKSRTIK